MPRFLIWIVFDGSPFYGWQAQPEGATVQQTLNYALSTLLKIPVEVVGAGRTDTGVHGRSFAAHFDLPVMISAMQSDDLTRKLNRFLPPSIAVSKIEAVKPDFHARYSALSRTYHYQIHTRKDPFLVKSSWFIDRPLQFEDMKTATQILKLHNDFQCFSKYHSNVKSFLCEIYEARWLFNDHKVIFEIKANRFLRNMVRAIVGTLVEVGLGKRTIEDFEKIILSRDRNQAGYSAPGHGLYLTQIEYPENYRIDFTTN